MNRGREEVEAAPAKRTVFHSGLSTISTAIRVKVANHPNPRNIPNGVYGVLFPSGSYSEEMVIDSKGLSFAPSTVNAHVVCQGTRPRRR